MFAAFLAERVANASCRPRPIVRMKMALPEIDLVRNDRLLVAEQRIESLWPGECAAGYIPNPNRIIRGPRGERKIFEVLRADERRKTAAVVRRIFCMSAGGCLRIISLCRFIPCLRC